MRTIKKRRWQSGQSLVEFSLIAPIIMAMVLAVAEFGVAFQANMSLVESTREGARVGAVLVNGAKSLGCPGFTGAASVDPQIIAAVQRVIESPASGISKDNVANIRIYKADASGGETAGMVNEWIPYASGAHTAICGVNLDFVANGTQGWPAASRANVLPVDSIGVSITYRYSLFTPLGSLTGLFGSGRITMVDSTVMDLEP